MKKTERRRPQVPEIRVDSLTGAICKLLDFAEDLQFWIKDRAGRYCWMNRRCLLNYGMERLEQAHGKTDYDLSPAHLADRFRFDDERVLKGHCVVNRIELVGRFDHTACWCLTNKVPLRHGAGRIVGTAGITSALKDEAAEQAWPTLGLGKVVAFVHQHYAQTLANADLAPIANLSIRAFERHFRRWFHISPQKFIKQVRVRMACRALVYGNQPLAQIAAEHGFYDQSHFTREFRRQMGMTPSAYRRRYHGQPR